MNKNRLRNDGRALRQDGGDKEGRIPGWGIRKLPAAGVKGSAGLQSLKCHVRFLKQARCCSYGAGSLAKFTLRRESERGPLAADRLCRFILYGIREIYRTSEHPH